MASSNYGVVSVIQPPILKSVDQPSLIKFETAYSAYCAKIDDVNKDRDENAKLSPASVKDCMEASTLHALCIMGEIPGITTVEEATAENVQNWFNAASRSAPKDLSERIDASLRSVTFVPNKFDPAGGVANFIINVITALDQNNASEVLQEMDMARKFIDRLVRKFQPDVLQERIRMLRMGWKKEQLANIKLFKDEVANIALEISLTETARARLNPRKSRHHRDRESRSEDKSRPEHLAGSMMSQKKNPTRAGGKRKVTEWTEPCLNEKCDGIHRLKDCPITPAELKKELFEKLFKNKNAKRAKSVKVPPSAGLAIPDANEERFRIALEDAVFDIVLGDSGSDFSAIDSSILNKVKTVMPDVHVKTFNPAIPLVGAFKADNETTFSASRSVILTAAIYLPGSNIPVRVRGIEFYVVDQGMDEILLGRPFLNAIGFNLKDHLLRVRDAIHGKHMSELDGNKSKLAIAKYEGLSYMMADDDPVELPECLAAGIGTDTKESIDQAFAKILSEAKANGISDKGCATLSHMLEQYRNVFRIKLGNDPPVDVPALSITPVENAKPYRSPQRRYAPQQRDFIVQTVRELEAVGAIYKNPSARWASPALAVPKPGSTKLRFTVDLRGPNARTVPIQSAMPHLESKFQDTAGSTCFANVDLAHGYWQVPLSPESQEMMSIQTPLGVYSSKRLLQGGSDSGNHFHAVLSHKFDGRVEKMLQLIDDFLFYAKNEQELLTNIDSFLLVCSEIGLKVHAQKSTFFSHEAHFCGRIISNEGVQYHPRHYESLVSMKTPTMANELQQFVCATTWMRNSIPAYAERIAPLHELLEQFYTKAGKKTKNALRNLSIGTSWGAEHDLAFTDIKKQLAASVKLAHPKSNCYMCLFSDASDTHWAAVLTQVPLSERHKMIEDQHHEPLCFLSGAFSGSAANWSVPEKEGFAIVEAMCRLDYLVMGHEVNIFTDHSNLVYLYDPYGRNPGISRHTASKLMRWAIKLSAFRYVIEHLSGERNVWADMLTHWAVSPKRTVSGAKVLRSKSLMMAPINPGLDSNLDWPNLEDIKKSQMRSKENPPKIFKESPDGYRTERNVLWIPSNDELLKLRIVVAAHTGHGGHRSSNVTLAAIKAHFLWKNVDENVRDFVNTCLHCLCTASGKIIPRPLGHGLHSDKPNELIHFDFCYMSRGEDDLLYTLIVKDDHSGYVWLTPTTEITAEVAANTLINWFAAFGVTNQWVSDRGSHFKNEVVRILKERTKSSHHFTLAYCPWSNGTVEVVCRELLRVCRALLSEYQLPHSCWPSVMPVVQSALNNTILERLGNRCPLTVFTGHPQDSPLTAITGKLGTKVQVLKLSDIRGAQLDRIKRLQSALDGMHKDVAERSKKKRQQAVESHNRKTNVRPINFT